MFRTALILPIAVFTVACVNDDFGDPDIFPMPAEMDSAVQGRLAGDLPLVGDFDQAADEGYGFATDDFLDLQLHASGEHGWAMIGINTRLDANGNAALDDGLVIGCSGPDAHVAEFDAPADAAEVTVEPIVVDGEDALQVEVVASFDGLVVTGSAVVPVHDGW